ncbi:alpha/beta fold hydrolase [Microbulbifer spongiae]|uniref:Alpha/beta hydrolase n=1 Tax=Microbulbifer spongiae TaxID=2944933 RepID=A0ABY9E8B0_9GAMM|nr:alpha/beta hydrolase [Microbulbifer sp. MI-G]WKD48670.1 alpha/beta hydrolase [Microbulbifer sp. MI-G]
MQSHLIDLNGQITEYVLLGKTGPVIVLESGLGDTLEVWRQFIEKSDIQGRFCLYNRVGYGKSKSRNLKRDGLTIAKELKILLHGLRLEPPYILIGHSLGCAFVKIFAGLYADEVNGILLIDPMAAEMDELCRINAVKGWKQSKIKKFLASIFLSKGAKRELSYRETSLKQAKENKSIISPIPVTIISAGRGMAMYSKEIQYQWIHSHDLVAHSIPGCTHIITENSQHHIQIDQPEIIVKMLKKLLHTATANTAFQRAGR